MPAPPGHVPAAEYARNCDPQIGKSAMSRLFGRGLPYVEGKDDHGRDCKFVDPHLADAWRVANCTPKMDGQGRLRGMPDLQNTPRASPSPEAQKAPSGGGHPPGPRVSSPRRPASIAPPASAGGGGDGEGAFDAARQIAQAKASEAVDNAIARRLRRLEAQGQLLDRDAAIDGHIEFVAQIGVTLDRMAADNATHLASELGCTEHRAFVALRKVGDRLRSDLESYANRRAESLGLEEELPEPEHHEGLD